jgi:hypothetical protein
MPSSERLGAIRPDTTTATVLRCPRAALAGTRAFACWRSALSQFSYLTAYRPQLGCDLPRRSITSIDRSPCRHMPW